MIAYRTDRQKQQLLAVRSSDNGRNWQPPEPVAALPLPGMGGGIACLDSDGRTHVILTHLRGTGTPGDTRFIDLWHVASGAGGAVNKWTAAKRIWEGYCGAVMDVKQLSSGRIVVPFAAWKRPGEILEPETGSNYTTAVYSDDLGETWTLAEAKLTSPCAAGFNGNNYGAIEPTILELTDDRVWDVDAKHRPGSCTNRFRRTASIGSGRRRRDFRRRVRRRRWCSWPMGGSSCFGTIANNRRDTKGMACTEDATRCTPRFPRTKVRPGEAFAKCIGTLIETARRRDGATAARRIRSPPKNAAGDVILVTGQGNRRAMLVVAPEWLEQQSQADDFDAGLAAWHVWKPFGAAEGYWRDRTQGARLVAHPNAVGIRCFMFADRTSVIRTRQSGTFRGWQRDASVCGC